METPLRWLCLLYYYFFLAMALEKEYEAKRLAKLKSKENACKEMQVSLREKSVGLRRPLQPK